MYGVATFVQGRWRAEVPKWDLEGRVVVVRRHGLAVVNVYAVNGTSKPYFDDAGRIAGDRHELKRRFQSSVMELGRELSKEGGVIMAGDWNVSRTAQDTHPRLRTEDRMRAPGRSSTLAWLRKGSSTSGVSATRRSARIRGSTAAPAAWMRHAWITYWSRATLPSVFAPPTSSISCRGVTTHPWSWSCEIRVRGSVKAAERRLTAVCGRS